MYVNKKKFISIVSVVLAVILCISALGILSGGFRNWDYKHWFDKNDLVLDPNGGVVSGNGEDMESGKVYPMSQNMTFKSPSKNSVSASTGVDIKATINPVTATNQAVDWTVTFINPSSTWATGKAVASFVTATPSADGSLTANIKCLAAFGEQIKITVTSRENASAKAECVIDYAKKLSKTNVSYGIDKSEIGLSGVGDMYDWYLHNSDIDVVVMGGDANITYSTTIGTTVDTYTTTVTLCMNPTSGFPDIDITANFLLNDGLFKKCFPEDSLYSDPATFNAFRQEFFSNQTSNGGAMSMITVRSVGKYSSYENIYTFGINEYSVPILVESATIDNGNLIF